jgi:hypothetical protein
LDESEDYDVFAREAHRIIDQLVNQSLAHVNDTVEISEQENVETPDSRGRFIESENEAKTHEQLSVQWPSIAQFTDEKVGIDKINEYIEKVIHSNLSINCIAYHTKRITDNVILSYL